MKSIEKKEIKTKIQLEVVIDLTGPKGNAFYLLAYARKLADEFEFEDTDALIEEMQSGDYEHLIQTFDEYFGDFITLER